MYTLTFEDRELLGCAATVVILMIYTIVCLTPIWYFKYYTMPRRTKRFVYCDGKKANVLWIELVTAKDFQRYEQLVGYGVIDMNATSIYFDARQER